MEGVIDDAVDTVSSVLDGGDFDSERFKEKPSDFPTKTKQANPVV